MSDPLSQLACELSGFTPVGGKEADDLRQMLSLVRSSESADRSHFLPGHFTSSAFIVHPATGSLLLHHHRRLDRWLQMGGHLENGETTAEAALREAVEESGLSDVTASRSDPLRSRRASHPRRERRACSFALRYPLSRRHRRSRRNQIRSSGIDRSGVVFIRGGGHQNG